MGVEMNVNALLTILEISYPSALTEEKKDGYRRVISNWSDEDRQKIANTMTYDFPSDRPTPGELGALIKVRPVYKQTPEEYQAAVEAQRRAGFDQEWFDMPNGKRAFRWKRIADKQMSEIQTIDDVSDDAKQWLANTLHGTTAEWNPLRAIMGSLKRVNDEKIYYPADVAPPGTKDGESS
jgi:hypothetical protein